MSQAYIYAIDGSSPPLNIAETAMRTLEEGDSDMKQVMKDFAKLCRGMSQKRLCFFYEQRPTIVRTSRDEEAMKVRNCPQFRSGHADDTKLVIVDGNSGSIKGYPSFALASNHFGVNKFDSPGDMQYQAARHVILQMARRALHGAVALEEHTKNDKYSEMPVKVLRAGSSSYRRDQVQGCVKEVCLVGRSCAIRHGLVVLTQSFVQVSCSQFFKTRLLRCFITASLSAFIQRIL